MSNRIDLLTPVGRLVQGSLYTGQTTDAENRPLVYKSGSNMGQPRQEFYFALAIPKGTERHWSETEWGKKIWAVGHTGFPNGQAQSPAFAWKVKDGDSDVPNRKGRKPRDLEGHPGHWVLNFSSGFAPGVYNADGTQQMLEPSAVNLGDYVQVYGSVVDNGSQQQPGIHLNHSMVALSGYGKRIVSGADPKTVGFGQSALPAGASATPLAQGFNPAPAAAAPPVIPHYGILTPPVAAVPAPAPVQSTRVMLPSANGLPYEKYREAGWTDEQLIQHGYMQM